MPLHMGIRGNFSQAIPTIQLGRIGVQSLKEIHERNQTYKVVCVFFRFHVYIEAPCGMSCANLMHKLMVVQYFKIDAQSPQNVRKINWLFNISKLMY